MGVEGVGLRGDGGWLEFEVEGRGGEGEVGLEGHFFYFFFSFLLGLFCFDPFFFGGMLGGWDRWGCVFVWMRMGIMRVLLLLLLLSSVIDVPALAGEVEAGWLFFRSFDWI